MKRQKDICKILSLSPATVSLVITGKRPVSWPLAVKLSELFPGKDIIGWKNAAPEDLQRAFRQLGTISDQKANKEGFSKT